MKLLDLFAGIGGISLAAEWAGIETVAFCEKEPFCQDVLRRRFPGRPIYDDVFNLTREVLEHDRVITKERGIDIVSGGFPCQPFSHAGKRTGTADDRYLWPEMCRIIGEIRPTWVFAENVNGLISMAQSDWNIVMEDETAICEEAEMVLETIRKDLEKIGYRSIPVVIPACGVGAAHQRYRVFILGYTDYQSAAYPCSIGFQTKGSEQQATRVAGNGKDVVDSGGAGCEERYTAAVTNQTGYNTRRGDAESMANTNGKPGLEADSPACPVGSKRDAWDNACRRGWKSGAAECGWPTQSGVGGSPYELSDWLDGFGMNPLDALINYIASYPQPALMGMLQYDWEPPRVATGVKNKAARLKALGNAVDPLQALPILYGIRVIHEFLQKGEGAYFK